MKKIYIVLSKPNTIISKAIGFATSSEYSHVGISLDASLSEIKSFGRKYDISFYPGCAKTESIEHKFFIDNILTIPVSVDDEQYDRAKSEIESIFAKPNVKYDFAGVVLNFLRIDKAPKDDRYFCSSFVAKVLVKAGVLEGDKPFYWYRPEDFLGLL